MSTKGRENTECYVKRRRRKRMIGRKSGQRKLGEKMKYGRL